MKKIFTNQLMLVLFFGAIMWGMSFRTPMWMDEYVFYKLALNFPDYAATSDWFFVDRPAMLSPNINWEEKGFDRREMFSIVYDTPIYPHTPLMPIIFSPLVKGLNFLADNEVLPHIEEETGYPADASNNPVAFQAMKAEVITNILRVISIVTVMLTLWLIYKIMEHKTGKSAFWFALPISTGVMMLYGAFLFYWDAFMMLFFVLTLYLMEVKPHSKWKYVTACCLVNTKMFLGIAFLFPLFVKASVDEIQTGWKWPIPGYKMALPILSIIPFYIATVIVTGNPIYLYEHYIAQVPIHDFIYTLNSTKDYLIILFNLGMYWFIPMTLPVVYYIKKYPAYVIFWAMSMFYAWATGLGITHTSTMVYSGALVVPLLVHEWGIVEKAKGLVGKAKLLLNRERA